MAHTTSSSAAALSASVTSLRSSLSLLDSSIAILDSGIADFPRLKTVLASTRVRPPPHPIQTSLLSSARLANPRAALRTHPAILLTDRASLAAVGAGAGDPDAASAQRGAHREGGAAAAGAGCAVGAAGRETGGRGAAEAEERGEVGEEGGGG